MSTSNETVVKDPFVLEQVNKSFRFGYGNLVYTTESSLVVVYIKHALKFRDMATIMKSIHSQYGDKSSTIALMDGKVIDGNHTEFRFNKTYIKPEFIPWQDDQWNPYNALLPEGVPLLARCYDNNGKASYAVATVEDGIVKYENPDWEFVGCSAVKFKELPR